MTQKNNFLVIGLGVINLICAIFHIIFQFDLLSENGIYRGFILTENMLITFVFLCFTWILWFGQDIQKKFFIRLSVVFWAVFLVLVLLIEPKVTTLSIIQDLLLFPQNYYLLLLGTGAFVLSLMSDRQSRVMLAQEVPSSI